MTMKLFDGQQYTREFAALITEAAPYIAAITDAVGKHAPDIETASHIGYILADTLQNAIMMMALRAQNTQEAK